MPFDLRQASERSGTRNWFMRAVVAGLGAVCLMGEHPASAATPQVGDAFPDLAGFELAGELPNMDAASVVIVDFWASWCAPCKASFPVFDTLYQDFEDKGLVIIAVSVDRNESAMKAFLKRTKPQFAVVHDTKQKLVAAADVPTMPTSFVLDGKGRVRFIHQGFHGEKSHRAYREQITSILSEDR
jgi:thiol-disulfide isomerase/thioredoxin